MDKYTISQIRAADSLAQAQLTQLLKSQGITLDANLDYTVGVFDDEYNLTATGSCYANTLRCLAVDSGRQGEGLMNTVVSHLVEYQAARGNSHLFIYTKCETAAFFEDLGFYEITRAGEAAAFLENRKNGFKSYLEKLAVHKKDDNSAAIVANCNPFTLGHRYLIERAASENSTVHLFVVSEDASLFSFADRYEMIKAGCAGLRNVIFHRTGSYMISSGVFPSYFLPDKDAAIGAQASLDIGLFTKIAKALGIKRRYVGEEPFSHVTNLYNGIMQKRLPESGISCIVIPRKEFGEKAISASYVRQLIHDGRLREIKDLVPESTFNFFKTEKGLLTIKKIMESPTVVHY